MSSTQPTAIAGMDWTTFFLQLSGFVTVLGGVITSIIVQLKSNRNQTTQHVETVQKIAENTNMTAAAAVISADNNKLLGGTGDGGMVQKSDVQKAVEVVRGTGTGQ